MRGLPLPPLWPSLVWRCLPSGSPGAPKCSKAARSQAISASALLHKPAPDFTLPTLDGRTISLADYRGKKVVLSFWASWCGPCRLELPVLRSFYEKTHKPGADYDLLAISLDEDRGAAEAAMNVLKLPFPVLLDTGQTTPGAYGVYGIPTLFVIDERGRVAYSSAGFNTNIEFILAHQLGIDPKIIAPGGPSGVAGH